jgi:sRNA-binding carbon storage regulator CsrA
MLVLTRKRGQRIRIQCRRTGDTVWLLVVSVGGGRCQIGIDATADYRVDREENLSLAAEAKEVRP